MDDTERSAQGMTVRREVLGNAHVDRAVAGTTPFTADFQSFITRYAWGEVWSRPGLSRAERLIVILYYFEEMTMKEIGATLDLSESRVSQMHSSILARLKAQMQHRSRELESTPT